LILENDFLDLVKVKHLLDSYQRKNNQLEYKTTLEDINEEINLIYVALTRAKGILELNENIISYLNEFYNIEIPKIKNKTFEYPSVNTYIAANKCKEELISSYTVTTGDYEILLDEIKLIKDSNFQGEGAKGAVVHTLLLLIEVLKEKTKKMKIFLDPALKNEHLDEMNEILNLNNKLQFHFLDNELNIDKVYHDRVSFRINN